MPELPEVETVRRGLQRHLVGRRIERVEVGRERSVRRTSAEAVVHGLSGTVVDAADRRGKYLLLPFDATRLRSAFGPTSRALKPLLLDQHVVAGIGNIYADEILHRAGLRPDRPASSLDRRRMSTLATSIVDVLEEAIDAGGSTLGDAQYVDLMGEGGSYQDDHRVYGRGGERCFTCGRGWIRRSVTGGRGTHWCPVCQR
jgi:formamidopyrimidine-DNA glycosylase